MKPRSLKAKIHTVGAVDWDRRLFDELIPLPDGTSYNSYLVEGSEKTVLIDTVDPTMTSALVKNLEQLDIRRIDFIVCNHAEQDHSGSLPKILDKYPDVEVLATSKCKSFLTDMLLIPENRILAVEDRQTLSLGNKTLEFLHFPWVHWPETMLTYLREDKILFTCDFFGSHLATSDLFVRDESRVYEAAKRYYAEIMMPFRLVIQKNMDKLDNLQIDIIAPSHGPAYDKPEFIIEAYKDWIFGSPKNVVVLPYTSMHGSTKAMVDYFVAALVERGITVQQFNLSGTDIGKLAIALVDAATIVLGCPTVHAGPHPNIVYAAYLANALRPKMKFASVIGSYGWGGSMVQQISQIISSLKLELLEPVVARGFPKEEAFKALDRLADAILAKHKENGLTA